MEIKKYTVAIVTAVCLISLAYISSLHEKFDFITSNAPFFVFFIYLINSDKIGNKNIMAWVSAIILVTIAVALVQIY